MICTVIQRALDTRYRIPGQNTGIHCRTQTFFNTRDIFLRNITADNRIVKFKSGIAFHRLKFDFNFCKLTGTTRLFLMRIFDIARFGNRFAVSNLRIADIGINLKFTA